MSRDLAMGTITLHLMLLLAPSMATVLLRPMTPNLAELEYIVAETC